LRGNCNIEKSRTQNLFFCKLENDRSYLASVAECLGPAHRTAILHWSVNGELPFYEQKESCRLEFKCVRQMQVQIVSASLISVSDSKEFGCLASKMEELFLPERSVTLVPSDTA
jgi:hypothetical protein